MLVLLKSNSNFSRILVVMWCRGIESRIPNVVLNGDRDLRYPGNLNFSFAYVEGESLLMVMLQAELCHFHIHRHFVLFWRLIISISFHSMKGFEEHRCVIWISVHLRISGTKLCLTSHWHRRRNGTFLVAFWYWAIHIDRRSRFGNRFTRETCWPTPRDVAIVGNGTRRHRFERHSMDTRCITPPLRTRESMITNYYWFTVVVSNLAM